MAKPAPAPKSVVSEPKPAAPEPKPAAPQVRAAAPPPRPVRRPPPPPPAPSHKWVFAVLALVLLGGGGVAGYYLVYVPKVETAAPVAPAPAKPAPPVDLDQRILGQVQRALSTSDHYQNVVVAVEEGVVTLSGYVPDGFSVEMAERLATGFVGIREIRNQIQVGEPRKPAAAGGEAAKKAEPPPAAAVERPAAKATRPGIGPEERRQVRELVERGNRQLDAGAYDAAIEAFQAALEMDRGNADARGGLRRAREAKQAEEEILQDRQ